MDQTPLLSRHLWRTRQPDHHICYCTLVAGVSPMALPAPTASSITLGRGGRVSAGPIFLGAQGREGGEARRGGTQMQLQVSSSQNIQMQTRRKKPPGQQVTQCQWASLVTWMAAPGSGTSGGEQPLPHLLSAAEQGSAARELGRAQGCGAGGAGGGLQLPSPPRRAPPPPRAQAHFGISPLNAQAATCSNVAWQF